MSEKEIETTEGLTLPADPKENKANQAHEKRMLESRKERLGEAAYKEEQKTLEDQKARRDSAVAGANLTEEQKQQLKDAKKSGDLDGESQAITGDTQSPADTVGEVGAVVDTTRSAGPSASAPGGPSGAQSGSPS